MAASHPDQELIEKRIADVEAIWNKGIVDEYIALMADDVSVSDYGLGMLNMNKDAARASFTNLFAATANLTMNTRGVSGHKYFTAWEWEAKCNYMKTMTDVPGSEEIFGSEAADGRIISVVGVSLMWWNEEGKILQEHDYVKPTTK